MTSLPIIYFAVFDYEYEKLPTEEDEDSGKAKQKRYLMKDSSLYGIGLNYECFNGKLFFIWIVYAMLQACFIWFICFYVMNRLGF